MHRLVRTVAVLSLVAGLLPTQMAGPAGATHADRPRECQEPWQADPSLQKEGYIPVAQDSPTEATTLHFQVFLPNPSIHPEPEGGYPAVMDYSGYAPGITIYDGLHRHWLCEGYAVIGLNMRGTGCSGGKFDYFEPRQAEDGREAIAWFDRPELHPEDLHLNGRIAMVGKSYPGITQLFVASQPLNPNKADPYGPQPVPDVPDNLVALVPGAVFGDLYRDVPFPGGIMNVTFSAGWSAGRIYEPLYDPFIEHEAIQNEDEQCVQNAAQHAVNPPFNPFVRALPNQYDGELFWERSPYYWAQNINVPTFLFETWQDEQVGSRATHLIERFKMNPNLEWRFLGTNGDHGGHGDYYGSHVMPEIDEFLSFYLKQEVPDSYPRLTFRRKVRPVPFGGTPPPPQTRTETDEEVFARYAKEPPVQINWDNGSKGERTPGWITTYGDWPPPNQEVFRLHFTDEGKLIEGDAPTEATSLSYRYEPGSSQQRGGYRLVDDDPVTGTETPEETRALWSETPKEDTYLMFTTEELTQDRLFAGPASVDLWITSTAPDTDLQVTLTEVREDGQEVFVQQGWLRASHRKELDPGDDNVGQSTWLRPFHSHQAVDSAMVLNPYLADKARVEIFPFAHAFRDGSKIRIYIEAPHVKPDLWGFAILPTPAMNTIHTGAQWPSSIALPLLAGETVPDDARALPPCSDWGRNGGLRNQPCRPTFNG